MKEKEMIILKTKFPENKKTHKMFQQMKNIDSAFMYVDLLW